MEKIHTLFISILVCALVGGLDADEIEDLYYYTENWSWKTGKPITTLSTRGRMRSVVTRPTTHNSRWEYETTNPTAKSVKPIEPKQKSSNQPSDYYCDVRADSWTKLISCCPVGYTVSWNNIGSNICVHGEDRTESDQPPANVRQKLDEVIVAIRRSTQLWTMAQCFYSAPSAFYCDFSTPSSGIDALKARFAKS
ncbi:hypothetical protein BV898_13388 [Hypsibius exemplaris]|uniref:Uncharacterized protein n=1 Tax=Hypsibius exemplaris TaxID=2072580 RepID=A0A1W0WB14_HYPEX|nr:hypothetical protein BV898_13388 [Hypsibius exemplaris]